MNAKKCKELRGIARARTEGLPKSRLIHAKQMLGTKKAGWYGRAFVTGAVNDPATTRGVYRQLKKEAR